MVAKEAVALPGPEDGERQRVHPNTYLNEYVTHYVLGFLDKAGLREQLENGAIVTMEEDASRVRRASFEHLTRVGILKKVDKDSYALDEEGKGFPQSLAGFDLVTRVADLQLQAIEEGTEVRRLIAADDPPELSRLALYGGQCLMLSSYVPLLANLWEIDQRQKEYGYKKELYRLQPRNALGSAEMMKQAAKKNAKTIKEYLDQKKLAFKDVAFIELGSGDARQSVEVLNLVPEGEPLPLTIATDIDPDTQGPAERRFAAAGFAGAAHWMKADMGDPDDLAAIANAEELKEQLKGKQIVIMVGYIFHESRDLANSTLAAIRKVFPDAILVISEYYRQDMPAEDVPDWFETVHDMSGQELFARDEWIDFMGDRGLHKMYEVAHQKRKDNGDTVNSVMIFEWEDDEELIFA